MRVHQSTAYAAQAEIKARVYVPDSASGPKRKQIETYGAELIPIPGPRSKASEAVMQAADEGNGLRVLRGTCHSIFRVMQHVLMKFTKQLRAVPAR